MDEQSTGITTFWTWENDDEDWRVNVQINKPRDDPERCLATVYLFSMKKKQPWEQQLEDLIWETQED